MGGEGFRTSGSSVAPQTSDWSLGVAHSTGRSTALVWPRAPRGWCCAACPSWTGAPLRCLHDILNGGSCGCPCAFSPRARWRSVDGSLAWGSRTVAHPDGCAHAGPGWPSAGSPCRSSDTCMASRPCGCGRAVKNKRTKWFFHYSEQLWGKKFSWSEFLKFCLGPPLVKFFFFIFFQSCSELWKNAFAASLGEFFSPSKNEPSDSYVRVSFAWQFFYFNFNVKIIFSSFWTILEEKIFFLKFFS